MKNILFIIGILTVLTSCGYRSETMMTVCTCEQKDKVADFIQSSIKNANNMSDEEMEDVIYGLRQTGFEVICDSRMIDGEFNSHHRMTKQYTVLDSCETIIR